MPTSYTDHSELVPGPYLLGVDDFIAERTILYDLGHPFLSVVNSGAMHKLLSEEQCYYEISLGLAQCLN